MPVFRETVTLYQGGIQAQTGTKNPVPKNVTLLRKNVPMNIHRGVPQTLDEATTIGIDPSEAAIGYAHIDYAADLFDRIVVLDSNNDAYIVAGKPSVRTRFAATRHVRCLLQFLKQRPSGLPS